MNEPLPDAAQAVVSANLAATTDKDDPLVNTWFKRIDEAKKHWSRFHQRVDHNRTVVRGIDDEAEPNTSAYNKHRANLIQSTISVVLSRVYAKNPEMSGTPTNKSKNLKLFSDTVSKVTQTMLEDAKLKKKAKSTVRAAMTCSFGVVKVQYQRDLRTDPLIQQRIQDTQDNIVRIEGLMKDIEDDAGGCDLEAQKRELEQALDALQATPEVVAAEGLVIDRVRTERLLVDPTVEDIWEYESADWLIEIVPMRKSKATGTFPDLEMDKATTYKVGEYAKLANDQTSRPSLYKNSDAGGADDPIIVAYECWNKADNTIYTLIDGIKGKFARKPYQPAKVGERWYPYFILPFQSVDGTFAAQSLVDVLERLQEEHNETRDKFAKVRKTIKPHYTVSGDVKEKDIKRMTVPDVGEFIVVDTGGQALNTMVQQGTQLTIDPALFDTTYIRSDWEMVSGLQEAARSVVSTPKTATEASISDQSLAARVSEFRDQVEDWLSEIAQFSSELCLLNMEPAQVEQIMGAPEGEPDGAKNKTYEWPENRTPETVFNLIQMQIRAGSTAAPNKLQMQDSWAKALPVLQQMIGTIRQIDAAGGDSTAERELVRETAARFDETIDVDRFLPAKPLPPAPVPALPDLPGLSMSSQPMQGGMPLPLQ